AKPEGMSKVVTFAKPEGMSKVVTFAKPEGEMKIKSSRKGIFFSIVSVFLVLMFVSSTELISDYRVAESEMEVTRTRVRLLNSVINDMENIYFEKIVYVAAKNSLVGLSRYYESGNYENIPKTLDYALKDVIHPGLLQDHSGNSPVKYNLTDMGYIDYGYTVEGLMGSISELFTRIGVKVNKFQVTIKSVEQADPWTLVVDAEIDYYFTDDNNIASWKGITEKKVNISVYGIHAFDYETGFDNLIPSNLGPITSSWVVDEGYLTEPSVLNKLSNRYTTGMGICSPEFLKGGATCRNDTR
ncbi:hypothetical protein JXC34_00835, partial [Candidatus Woesearchaeota archaeon]|nr:hypothetical protein [Candidatus Woesearchaeota archaeon]